MHHHHGHGNEGFADAEKAAARLNSPERDAWQRPEVILAALRLTAGQTVADVGAGTGYMVGHLSRAVGASGTVVAVDVSAAMVAYLAERAEQFGPATVRTQLGGADDPGLGRESVDAVLALDVWHHLGVHHHGRHKHEHGQHGQHQHGGNVVSGRVAYAEKIFAALRPGGRLVVVEATLEAEVGPPVEMRIGPEVVERELVGVGFRVEVVRDGLPRHYLVVGGKVSSC